jgi:hypothetical protein
MKWVPAYLNEPYKSAEDAYKAKQNVVLEFCFLIAIQMPLVLFARGG